VRLGFGNDFAQTIDPETPERSDRTIHIGNQSTTVPVRRISNLQSFDQEKDLDKQSLAVGNHSLESESILKQCEHGLGWEECESGNCQEIWQLYQRAIREESRQRADWVAAQKARARRGKKKSKYEIALEQSRASKREDYEIKLPRKDDEGEPKVLATAKLLRNVFPDEMTLRAAVQFRAVTLRQAELLEAYFDSDEGLANYKRWDAIGRKIGCSGKTVEREFRTLVEKFLKPKPNKAGDGYGTAIEVHIRGEREPRYYRKHSVRFGEWKREWSELITDKKVIGDLRREHVPMTRSNRTPILSSRVNWLFGELIHVFANQVPEREHMPADRISAADWEYNVLRARRILERKHAGPWTALEVYYALGRGARRCADCRTLLIRGFRINGSRITRARKFCGDACKMKAKRQKKN
jgi:hypothetical protein